jgi:hypothetical protein
MSTLARVLVKIGALTFASLIATSALAQLQAHPVVATFRPTEAEIFPKAMAHGPHPVELGRAVAIRDVYALAGMPGTRDNGGSVATFMRNTSNVWQRTGTLVPNDPTATTRFGQSLAFRSNIAVVGSTNAAYVFRRDNNVWKQILKLTPPTQDAVTDFAVSVQYQNGIVVVGAYRLNAPGAVYIFQIDTAKRAIVRRARLTAVDGHFGDGFGTSVSITHDTIVVGSPGAGRTGSEPPTPGAAYVFRLNGTGWSQRQKLIAADIENGDRFGTAVAIDRSMIVVGAPGVDRTGDYFGVPADYYAGGAAYVFVPANGLYAELQKLRPRPDESADYHEFGSSIAMFDPYIVVAADSAGLLGVAYHPPGYGFTYTRSGNTVASRGIAHMDVRSWSVSIANNWLFMGTPTEDRCGQGACIGHAVVFNLNTSLQ